jgi:hypothetical protein
MPKTVLRQLLSFNKNRFLKKTKTENHTVKRLIGVSDEYSKRFFVRESAIR